MPISYREKVGSRGDFLVFKQLYIAFFFRNSAGFTDAHFPATALHRARKWGMKGGFYDGEFEE